MAEDVAETARDEDKGPNRDGVSRREPTHLARLIPDAEGAGNNVLGHDAQGETSLSEELGGADDGDKEGFTSKGLGAFDTGLRMALEVVVVDMVAMALV